jgi:hypothetical protein
VASCCECSDEPSGSFATELVSQLALVSQEDIEVYIPGTATHLSYSGGSRFQPLVITGNASLQNSLACGPGSVVSGIFLASVVRL